MGEMYEAGIQSIGQKNTPGCLKWGCFGVIAIPVIGTIIAQYQNISVQAYEHLIPTCIAGAALITSGLYGLSRIIQRKD